ncbi:MAG: hypothetical protein RIS94_3240 [Pseudomonadota bacterium]|jgi:uncharacterized membrane protein YphA (DoxX/SURF4 family)
MTPLARNRAVALLCARLVIGVLSMLIGFHKIFLTGLEAELRWFQDLRAWFPDAVLRATNIYCAVAELVAGTLICLGLLRDSALYVIGSVLVIVTVGHSLEHEVWDIQQMMFRLSLVLLLLLLPAEWDVVRLPLWPFRRNGNA